MARSSVRTYPWIRSNACRGRRKLRLIRETPPADRELEWSCLFKGYNRSRGEFNGSSGTRAIEELSNAAQPPGSGVSYPPTLCGRAPGPYRDDEGDQPESSSYPACSETSKLSPFYGLRREVHTISYALSLPGANKVRPLALSFSLVQGLRRDDSEGRELPDYWHRSLISGVA